MKISYVPDYEHLSRQAADLVLEEVERQPAALICAATGNSPLGTYRLLAREAVKHPSLFNSLRIIKLDEWCQVPPTHPSSCEYYLFEHLVKPLNILPSNYFGFETVIADPKEESCRIKRILRTQGPIDLAVLGLGKNGHLGFIEPADYFSAGPHVARLSSSSRNHAMIKSLRFKPSQGLTLGMDDLLRARRILLLVTGSGKEQVLKKLLARQISTRLPASFLYWHDDVTCLIDQQAT